jgi:hypothetical protein
VSITLDVGAVPDDIHDYTPTLGCGQYALWLDGNFSIDGVTDTGFAAGTDFGWKTVFQVDDIPCFPANNVYLQSYVVNGSRFRGISLISHDYHTVGDGIANVPNPWNPRAADEYAINIWDYDLNTGVGEWGRFTIDPANIVIDGHDTGIQDFAYAGKFVSQHLDDCAANAKNHGDYVSCVGILTHALRSAGLLTGEHKGLLMYYAASSNIGK